MLFLRKTTGMDTQLANGSGKRPSDIQDEKPATIRWRIPPMNEWIFSISLLLLSLSIVLGKLYTNYGNLTSWHIGDQYSLPSVTTFARIYNTIGVPNMSVLPKFDVRQLPANSEKFLNVSNQYAEVAANILVTCYEKYGWLLRAAMSGLVVTSFTWFIIYKDSNIPGINPPSPFSPSRHRVRDEGSRIHLNYLVAILNGILFFIYMCL